MALALPLVALPPLAPNLGRGPVKVVAGEYIFVLYDEVAEPWHERLVLFEDADAPGLAWVLTPDDDIYSEDLLEFKNVVAGAAGGARRIPIGLGAELGQPVYRFKISPTARQFFRYTAEATALRDAEKELEGEQVLSEVEDDVAHTPRAEPDTAPTHRRLRTKTPLLSWAVPRKSWIALDSCVGWGVAAGDAIDVADFGPGGYKGVEFGVGLLGTQEIAVKLVDAADVASAADALRGNWKVAVEEVRTALDASEDALTIASRIDQDGERVRDFIDAVSLMWEEPFSELEFPTSAPRATWWWLKDLKRSNLTPSRHHGSWAKESDISHKDRSYHEHEIVCEVIEAAACIDQLNVPSLWCMELLVRRLMLLEKAHSVHGQQDWSSSELWTDTGRRPGGIRVAPDLQKHVAGRQAEANSIAKEQRKAAEERRLTRKDKDERPPKAPKGISKGEKGAP